MQADISENKNDHFLHKFIISDSKIKNQTQNINIRINEFVQTILILFLLLPLYF